MSEASQNLSGVSETTLAPLYWRAMESQRPDAMLKDERAVALVTQMSLDFSRVRQIKMSELLNSMRIIFTREFDRFARDFLARHPEAVVVHIGCGLDSRFERVAERNSQVEWYDLDLPDVIALRRKYLGDERERYQTASTCSTSGASSTSLSRGWPPFAGWPPSFACSSQCASCTSGLERRQGERI